MPAGTIADPAKVATHTVQGTPTDAAAALGVFTQSLSAGTLIHSMTTVRGKNTQGLIITLLYELP